MNFKTSIKKIVIDLDDTLCSTIDGDYSNSVPKVTVIEKLKEYRELGFEIAISTSRNMRTYGGSVGKINAHTLPIIIQWLERHGVPYDEVHVGKPWCGDGGFYVDDKAIRPDEFLTMAYEQVCDLLSNKR